MHETKIWFALFALVVSGTTFADAPASGQKPGSETKGRYWIDARLRNENVDQDNVLSDASAITLRTRVGYETEKYRGFQLLIEGENILAVHDDYNSTTNGQTQYSVIADPEDTEINRIFMTYAAIKDTSVAIGRQKIIFDNARFVGNVGWRQNEQTFDSLTVVNSSIPDTTIKFAYIDKVRRIFGPDSPNGTTDMSSPMVNVTYKGFSNIAVTGYGYFLEFDDTPLSSQRTVGIRLKGKYPYDGVDLKYVLDIADQQEYQGGSSAIDATYFHVAVTAGFKTLDVGVGYENLGGDGNYGFQTPLATAHAFNGWADQFLSTPTNGLTDTYLSLAGNLEKVKLKAVYHRFKSDFGNQDYGTEIDLIATRKFGNHFLAGVKYANYSADQRSVDTAKLWLFGQFSY